MFKRGKKYLRDGDLSSSDHDSSSDSEQQEANESEEQQDNSNIDEASKGSKGSGEESSEEDNEPIPYELFDRNKHKARVSLGAPRSSL